MAEQKLNKDGLVPGSLVSAKDHADVLRKKKQAQREADAKKAK